MPNQTFRIETRPKTGAGKPLLQRQTSKSITNAYHVDDFSTWMLNNKEQSIKYNIMIDKIVTKIVHNMPK